MAGRHPQQRRTVVPQGEQRRRAAGSASAARQRKLAAARFRRWLHDHDAAIEGVPPGTLAGLVAIWALDLAETGSVKPGTIYRYVLWAVDGLADEGIIPDRKRLLKVVGRITANVERNLDVFDSRAVQRHARPITAAVMRTLLAALDAWENNPGGMSRYWLLRLRVMLVFMYTFALRASEAIRARWSWLQIEAIDATTDAIRLTIPHSKWQQSPVTLTALVETGPYSIVRLLEDWKRDLAAVGAPVDPTRRIFFQTSKYRDLPFREPNKFTGSMRGKTLADFAHVADELVEPGAKPDSLPAGSNRLLKWRCGVCGHVSTGRLRARIASGSCKPCVARRAYFQGSAVTPPAPAAGRDWIDLIEVLISDPAWHSNDAPELRELAAQNLVYNELLSAIKKLAAHAGVPARTAYELIGTHGPRRGRATDAANEDLPFSDIVAYLRHTNPTITLRYIDGRDLTVTNPVTALDGFTADGTQATRRLKDRLG